MLKRAPLLSTFVLLLSACGDDGGAEEESGTCVRNDASAYFCFLYSGIPQNNVADVETGCTGDWQGTWTLAGTCPTETLVGSCTLQGDPAGGADSAVMSVYEPTDATTAENDICAGSGTWKAGAE